MKIAILGRTQILLDTMQLLSTHGHSIVLVGTCKAADVSMAKEDDFKAYGKLHHIPFFNSVKLHDSAVFSMLQDCGADICISMNWMGLITSDVRGVFPLGVLNAHMGDLPRYRGNATPNWAILNGEREVVLCIHEMVDELDAGPVYLRRTMPLREDTRIGEVYRWAEDVIPAAYAEVADAIEQGSLTPVAQPVAPDLALRCYPRFPEDSQIDWNCHAKDLARLVNASSEPFSGAYSFIENTQVRIWRAYALEYSCESLAMPGQVLYFDKENGHAAVATGHGILVLVSISINDEAERRRPTEYIRSLRTRFHSNGWIAHTPCFK